MLPFYVLSFWPQACRIITSQPGIKPAPAALGDEVLTLDSQGSPFHFYWNVVGWQCCDSFTKCTAKWFRICILFFTFTSIAGYNRIFGRVGIVLWVRKYHTRAKSLSQVLQAGLKNAVLTMRVGGRQREPQASWASYVPDTDQPCLCGCWAMPPWAGNSLHYTLGKLRLRQWSHFPELRNVSRFAQVKEFVRISWGWAAINGRTDIQNELSSVLYMELTTVKETELSMSQTLLWVSCSFSYLNMKKLLALICR